jgi:hypothetical protein
MSPSILVITNWVAWACAQDSNSSSNSICLITNFSLDFINKAISFPSFYFVSLHINRTFCKFVHGFRQVIGISNQCSFARCYFVGNLRQFARHTIWGKRRTICRVYLKIT